VSITSQLLNKLKRNIRENTGKRVRIDPDVATLLTNQQQDCSYGARPMRRMITEQIETPLADHMIEHPDQRVLHVQTQDGQVLIT
jgi:ATP-dependent Clp protease ATP-binding subunit ClpA